MSNNSFECPTGEMSKPVFLRAQYWVLPCFLFLVYINDLTENFRCSVNGAALDMNHDLDTIRQSAL